MRWAICPGCGASLNEEAGICPACGADLFAELLPLQPNAPRATAPHPSRVPRRLPRSAPLGTASGSPHHPALILGTVLVVTLAVGALGRHPPGRVGGTDVGEVARRARTGPAAGAGESAAPAGPASVVYPPDNIPLGWTWRPVGPLPARQGHVSTWTGTEVVIWGGERPGRSPEGAAYDPETGVWRRLSRSPLVNRTGAAAAWTGHEVLVWGGVNGGGELPDGAAYDPKTDRWRRLAAGPLRGRVPLAWAWTGTEFLIVGREGYGLYDGITDAAAYNPATDSWRALPDMPIQINEGSGVWTGKKLVVYGGFLDRNRGALAPNDRAEGAVYDPATGDWRRLPESPLSGQAIALAWDGTDVVAWDYELESAAYDPATEGWTALAPLPLEHRDCLPVGIAAGHIVVAIHCGQAALLEPGRRTWREVPAPAEAAGEPVWTGRELVLWLAPSGRSHDGTWIRPLAD